MLKDFLSSVLPDSGPYPWSLGVNNNKSSPDIDALTADIQKAIAGTRNKDIYFSPCATKGARRAEDFICRRAFVLDIDVKPGKLHNFQSQSEAITALIAWCNKAFLTPTWVVNSGHGVHAYWVTDQQISDARLYVRIGSAIILNITKHGDARLASDRAQSTNTVGLLRPITTNNYKYDMIKQVQGKQLTDKRYDLTAIATRLKDELALTNVGAKIADRDTAAMFAEGYNTPANTALPNMATPVTDANASLNNTEVPLGVGTMVRMCGVVAREFMHQENTIEPVWQVMATLTTRDPSGDDALSWFMLMSMRDHRFDSAGTADKFDRAMKVAGPKHSSSAVRYETLEGKGAMLADVEIMCPKGGPVSARRRTPVNMCWDFSTAPDTNMVTVTLESFTFKYPPIDAPAHLKNSYGFTENNDGGIDFVVQKKAPKGSATPMVDDTSEVSAQLFWLVARGRTIEGQDDWNRFARRKRAGISNTSGSLFETFYMNSNTSVSETEINVALDKQGINIYNKALALQYVSKEKKRMQNVAPLQLIETPGWQRETDGTITGFALGSFFIGVDKTTPDSPVTADIASVGFGPMRRNPHEAYHHKDNSIGSLEDYIENVVRPMMGGTAKQVMPVLMGMGAPLAVLFEDTHSARISFVGQTATRKTTLMRAIHGCYIKTDAGGMSKLNKNSSAAGVNAVRSRYNNVLIATDDMTLDDDDPGKLTNETLAEGTGDASKANRDRSLAKQRQTMVVRFISSNKSMMEHIDKSANHNTFTSKAAKARMLEFSYAGNGDSAVTDMTTDQMTAFDTAISESSGWLGLHFITWMLRNSRGVALMNNRDGIKAMFTKKMGGDSARIYGSVMFGAMCAAEYLSAVWGISVKDSIGEYVTAFEAAPTVEVDTETTLTALRNWVVLPTQAGCFPVATIHNDGSVVIANVSSAYVFGWTDPSGDVYILADAHDQIIKHKGSKGFLFSYSSARPLSLLLPNIKVSFNGRILSPNTKIIKV